MHVVLYIRDRSRFKVWGTQRIVVYLARARRCRTPGHLLAGAGTLVSVVELPALKPAGPWTCARLPPGAEILLAFTRAGPRRP
jgi:hypothetical protein